MSGLGMLLVALGIVLPQYNVREVAVPDYVDPLSPAGKGTGRGSCRIQGCTENVQTRGLCKVHYNKFNALGITRARAARAKATATPSPAPATAVAASPEAREPEERDAQESSGYLNPLRVG